MSGHGAPEARPVQGAGHLRVAIVAAQWHDTVMTGLLEGARRACADSRPAETIEVRVPGTFELVVAATRLVDAGYDAVVALGVVIRGSTPHFDYVCQGVTTGLSVLTQRTGVPIGFGVLTCNTEAEAVDRAGLPGSNEDKGYEAAVAALQTAVTLNALGSAGGASADKVSAAGEQH